MNTYGLIGYPLGHSFSKEYFTQKFKEEGISAKYELFPLQSIDNLPALIKNQPGLLGLNITIPFKQQVFQQLYDATNLPPQLDACNCIKIKAGKTYGYNTDIIGFERSILPNLKNHHKKALILGNGGAAKAACHVFKKNQVEYAVVNRTKKDGASFTYADLNEEIISEHLVIVNTTPLGMHPALNTFPDIPYQAIGEEHFLFDMVYNPAKTLFLQKGEERGAKIQNGYEMFIIQAEESWRIWNEA